MKHVIWAICVAGTFIFVVTESYKVGFSNGQLEQRIKLLSCVEDNPGNSLGTVLMCLVSRTAY